MGRILNALERAEQGRAELRGDDSPNGEVEVVLEPVNSGMGIGPRSFRSRSILIGRGEHNDFGFGAFDAPTVSSHHAELRRETDGFFVYDMGSLNGVYKDGCRVRRAALDDGDVFGLGRNGPLLRVVMRALAPESRAMVAAGPGDGGAALFIEEDEPAMTRERLLLRLLLLAILVDAALSLARLF